MSTRKHDLIRLLSKIDERIVSATLRSGAEVNQLRDIDISGIVVADVLRWTHEALVILATDLSDPQPAVAMTSPASQSSVEIESRQKGPPGIKVKVYDAVPSQALAQAMHLYGEAVTAYAGPATAKGAPEEVANGHA